MTTHHPALTAGLECAVPLEIARMRDWTPEQRRHVARAAADQVAAHGDDLQYGGRECAATFTALARGLAAAAYQPGGVTWAGAHWCTNHAECEVAERKEAT